MMRLKIKFVNTNIPVYADYDEATHKLWYITTNMPTVCTITEKDAEHNLYSVLFEATNIPVDAYIEGFAQNEVTAEIQNGTLEGPTKIGSTGTFKLLPALGYKCPETITVTGGNYTYDAATGVISLTDVTGDVTISAVCVVATAYTVTTTVKYGTSDAPETIYEGSVVKVTITPNETYFVPAEACVNVEGASFTYNNGVITLSNPTANVVITAACSAGPQLYWGGIIPNPTEIPEDGTPLTNRSDIPEDFAENGVTKHLITEGEIFEYFAYPASYGLLTDIIQSGQHVIENFNHITCERDGIEYIMFRTNLEQIDDESDYTFKF